MIFFIFLLSPPAQPLRTMASMVASMRKARARAQDALLVLSPSFSLSTFQHTPDSSPLLSPTQGVVSLTASLPAKRTTVKQCPGKLRTFEKKTLTANKQQFEAVLVWR